MKKNTKPLFYALALMLCTACASFDPDVTEFSGLLTGMYCFIFVGLSTPRLIAFIKIFSEGEENNEEDDMVLLKSGAARREDLKSYETANNTLIGAVCIPVIVWFLVLFGMNGGIANIVGFILGLIVSLFIGRKIFLYSDQLRPITVIVRIIMLIVGLIFFFTGE